jgi:type II secretory pathway component PulF
VPQGGEGQLAWRRSSPASQPAANSPPTRHPRPVKVKVFGPLFHKTALSRFSRTLATLIRSGVPILQALEIVGETVNNQVISRAVRDVQDSVR